MTHLDDTPFLWLDDPSAGPVHPVHEGRDPDAAAADVPGEVGLWIFILGDMSIFGAFFAVFCHELAEDRPAFAAGTQALHQDIGAVNTLLLLVSSYLVVLALRGRPAQPLTSVRWLTTAILCGALFVLSKAVEYAITIGGGHTPADGTFFTFYFVLTGVHLLHVLIGMCLLGGWRLGARRGALPSERFREGAAVYWHMVDLLWLVIFALLYLGSGA